MQPRTSQAHPLRIAAVPAASGAGLVGITFCPGKCGDSLYGMPWRRDLAADLQVIAQWGPQMMLTLLETEEMALLGVPDLGARVREQGIEWQHLPIRDGQAPASDFEVQWSEVGAAAVDLLRGGGRVLVHCRGGLGRAGTVAACLLIETGFDAREAVWRVRTARPGAIETPVQERFVLHYVPRFRSGKEA